MATTNPMPNESFPDTRNTTTRSSTTAEKFVCYLFAAHFFVLGFRIGLAHLLSLSPFAQTAINPLGNLIFASLGACIFVMFDLRLKRLHTQQYLLLIFFIVAVFSQLPSIHTNPDFMLIGLLGDVSLFGMSSLLIANTNPQRVFFSVAKAMFWATILTSAVTLSEINWAMVSWASYNRLGAYQEVVDGNTLSIQAALSMLFGLAIFKRTSSLISKSIILVGVAFLFVIVLLAVSKTVFIAFTAVFVFWIIVAKMKTRVVLIVLAAVALFSLKESIFGIAIISHIDKYISFGLLGNLTNRTEIWRIALSGFSTYFKIFFGHGYNAISGITVIGLGDFGRIYSFHSELINSLWSVGIIGAPFLLFPFYWHLISAISHFSFSKTLKTSEEQDLLFWIICFGVFYVVMGLVETMLGLTGITFFVFIVIFCVYCEIRQEDISRRVLAPVTS